MKKKNIFQNQSQEIISLFEMAESRSKVMCIPMDYAKKDHMVMFCNGNNLKVRNWKNYSKTIFKFLTFRLSKIRWMANCTWLIKSRNLVGIMESSFSMPFLEAKTAVPMLTILRVTFRLFLLCVQTIGWLLE